MAQSVVKLQSSLMREYYKYFSKYSRGKTPENKVAWVTSFTPVEILEALDILYYYPESYAAVIAASEMEQGFLEESEKHNLTKDCCSYACCIEGCLELEDGPRGIPPRPDILIATNNQCNTLPNWWSILAERYNVPLVVIDYPGETVSEKYAEKYVYEQHMNLIRKLEDLSENTLNEKKLSEMIENSKNSVEAWKKVIKYMSSKDVSPTMMFDAISYLITTRCNPLTAELYELMAQELSEEKDAEADKIPLFWTGYPLWYHEERYLLENLRDFKIVGSNYLTWWNLDYEGSDVMESLFNAYNYTFLNLSQTNRNKRLKKTIDETGAVCTVVLKNTSCKCDFVSAKNIDIPQAELEIDMIDRNVLDITEAEEKIELLRDIICSR